MYIGTKLVNAEPMTRQQYNDFRGWTLPADENGADEGYLVEYLDGGKPNVPTHAGYVSWSPKAQFDAAYVNIGSDADGLPPHMQRVAAERAELEDRRQKLSAFSNTERFTRLPKVERELMAAQYLAMTHYSTILAERLAAAKEAV